MRCSTSFLITCIPLSLLTGCPAEPNSGSDSETAAVTTSGSDSGTASGSGSESETGADSGTSTNADSGTTTGGGNDIPGCECIVDEDDANPPQTPSAPTCGDSLCPEVMAMESDGETGGPFEVLNPEALTCALTALRDRTPGIVTWDSSDGIGQFENDGYILINADGTAVRRDYGWQDVSYIAGDAVLGPLEAPEHYTECLADTSPEARFDCLTAALAATVTCDTGFSYNGV